jgi:hypothetical protein
MPRGCRVWIPGLMGVAPVKLTVGPEHEHAGILSQNPRIQWICA